MLPPPSSPWPLALPPPPDGATPAIAAAGRGEVSRSSSDSRIGASSSRSQTGSSIVSFSRLRSERVVKNRNRMAPRPSSTYLASPSGLLAGAAAVDFAKATCPIEMVSPRLVWMPAALVIASRIAGSEAAGTEWSSSTETCWLSTVPGAIVE